MKISVIIPIYNCEKYLGECLDSVLGQTWTGWECICVDDGSTDRSGLIADEYSTRDSRVRVVHKKNGGEGSARNAGLEVFRGDWVYFLDSDDVLNNQTLEMCMQGVAVYPESDLSSVCLVAYADGTNPAWGNDNPPTFEAVDISKMIDARAYGLSVWNVAYRADIVRDLRFGNLKIGADRVYVAQVLERASHLVRCSYVGHGYRARLGSAVNTQLTPEKFLHELRHSCFWLSIFKTTRKTYAQDVLNGFAKNLTEFKGHSLFELSARNRKAVCAEYCQALRQAWHLHLWRPWPSFVMAMCGFTRFCVFIWVLCFLPYWLKSHGINRAGARLPEKLV